MNKFFLSFLLLTLTGNCFSQYSYYQDSLANTYDYLKNQPFAELELEDTSGNIIKTNSLLGKTVYVDFWFTTCPPCIKEISHLTELHNYFSADTSVVFLSICIENIERKAAWKQMIKEKQIPGIHLFYVRNRPQRINLLRKYDVTFPTYLLLNTELKVIGYNAPRPSEENFVRFAIQQSQKNIPLSQSYLQFLNQIREKNKSLQKPD